RRASPPAPRAPAGLGLRRSPARRAAATLPPADRWRRRRRSGRAGPAIGRGGGRSLPPAGQCPHPLAPRRDGSAWCRPRPTRTPRPARVHGNGRAKRLAILGDAPPCQSVALQLRRAAAGPGHGARGPAADPARRERRTQAVPGLILIADDVLTWRHRV